MSKEAIRDTARVVGLTERTVREEINMIERMPGDVRDLIRGTALANHKADLMRLSRLPIRVQRLVGRLIARGHARRVDEALVALLTRRTP
jgi:hypothetical protein